MLLLQGDIKKHTKGILEAALISQSEEEHKSWSATWLIRTANRFAFQEQEDM